ncbi:MAG TPA: hypothetical protein VMR62_08465 [Bryobacteraceae bacterium]|nr:hypothetical protein [Bryobacteraceae bacterium]
MAAVTQAAPLCVSPPVARLAHRWIISRGIDLTFVIGSSLAGYAYLVANVALHVPISLLWWFWSVGFDGTHIFGTASRTFFDSEARHSRRALLFGSAAFFFALGPILVLVGGKAVLAMIVAVWAYYHVIRQHYGFMVLYKVKNRDLARLDNFLDRWFLGVMTVFPPFHRFFIHHPEELGLHFSFPRLEPFLWALIAATVLVYAGRQAVRLRRKDPVNLPKFLLFAGVIPLHWLTFAYMSWLGAVPTVTIVHNLQYHALIWFHNRNRYGVASSPAASHGRIPRAVSRSLLNYVLVALVFSALYRVPGFHLGQASDLAFGFFCGFGLTHYYLDSKIWRVRSDPALRQVLQLA